MCSTFDCTNDAKLGGVVCRECEQRVYWGGQIPQRQQQPAWQQQVQEQDQQQAPGQAYQPTQQQAQQQVQQQANAEHGQMAALLVTMTQLIQETREASVSQMEVSVRQAAAQEALNVTLAAQMVTASENFTKGPDTLKFSKSQTSLLLRMRKTFRHGEGNRKHPAKAVGLKEEKLLRQVWNMSGDLEVDDTFEYKLPVLHSALQFKVGKLSEYESYDATLMDWRSRRRTAAYRPKSLQRLPPAKITKATVERKERRARSASNHAEFVAAAEEMAGFYACTFGLAMVPMLQEAVDEEVAFFDEHRTTEFADLVTWDLCTDIMDKKLARWSIRLNDWDSGDPNFAFTTQDRAFYALYGPASRGGPGGFIEEMVPTIAAGRGSQWWDNQVLVPLKQALWRPIHQRRSTGSNSKWQPGQRRAAGTQELEPVLEQEAQWLGSAGSGVLDLATNESELVAAVGGGLNPWVVETCTEEVGVPPLGTIWSAVEAGVEWEYEVVESFGTVGGKVLQRKAKRKCLDFARGDCSYGDACKFSHDLEVPQAGASGELCRNFAANGTCRFGDSCKFSHSREARPSAAGAGGVPALVEVAAALLEANSGEKQYGGAPEGPGASVTPPVNVITAAVKAAAERERTGIKQPKPRGSGALRAVAKDGCWILTWPPTVKTECLEDVPIQPGTGLRHCYRYHCRIQCRHCDLVHDDTLLQRIREGQHPDFSMRVYALACEAGGFKHGPQWPLDFFVAQSMQRGFLAAAYAGSPKAHRLQGLAGSRFDEALEILVKMERASDGRKHPITGGLVTQIGRVVVDGGCEIGVVDYGELFERHRDICVPLVISAFLGKDPVDVMTTAGGAIRALLEQPALPALVRERLSTYLSQLEVKLKTHKGLLSPDILRILLPLWAPDMMVVGVHITPAGGFKPFVYRVPGVKPARVAGLVLWGRHLMEGVFTGGLPAVQRWLGELEQRMVVPSVWCLKPGLVRAVSLDGGPDGSADGADGGPDGSADGAGECTAGFDVDAPMESWNSDQRWMTMEADPAAVEVAAGDLDQMWMQTDKEDEWQGEGVVSEVLLQELPGGGAEPVAAWGLEVQEFSAGGCGMHFRTGLTGPGK